MPLRATAGVPADALLVIASDPVLVPEIVGANCTMSVVAWPGLRVIGVEAPRTENPEPVETALLIVTGPEPLDVKVTDCVDEVPTAIVPKLSVLTLALSPGAGAMS